MLPRIFTLATQCKLVDKTPCNEVRKFDLDHRRRRYLLDEEEPLLLAACAGRLEHLRPLIVAAVGTWMRRGEQMSLRKTQVDFQRDVVSSRRSG